jgi:hypothetical protein
MPDYDFHTLSPIDFEELSRDLLQREFNTRFESFKPGKDGGIDLRGFLGKKRTIVQCKHYKTSGFKALFRELKCEELPKIERLKPKRYILTTSIALNPAEKKKLFNLLNPFVTHESDIIHRNDINNLLARHQEVERQHFKLWLSSTNILENLLHANILRETETELADIGKKSRVFVMNDSYGEALKLLRNHHYCIIAGIPGIGKTILAKMIVLNYLHEGFQFVSITRDIADAFSLSSGNKPRVYLYDDFLGRTALSDKLGKNEDQRLSHFIQRIQDSKHDRLILTTREYILHQAQQTYEALNHPIFNKPQCIIDLSNYTRLIRSKILFNHLYFSELDRPFIMELVRDKHYLKIIDHENFNPRIIEHLTNPLWVGVDADHADYPKVFVDSLKNPTIIWERVFLSQISSDARNLLVVLASLPPELFLNDLHVAFNEYNTAVSIESVDRFRFDEILKELEGNFTVTHSEEKGLTIGFHNPSLVDFLELYLGKQPEAILGLLRGSVFFEQLQFILNSKERHATALAISPSSQSLIAERCKTLLNTVPCRLINWGRSDREGSYKNRDYLESGRRLSYICSKTANIDYAYLKSLVLDQLPEIQKDISRGLVRPTALVDLLRHMIPLPFIDKQKKNEMLKLSKESIISDSSWVSDIAEISDFFKVFPHMKEQTDLKKIELKVKGIVGDMWSQDYSAQALEDEKWHLERIQEEHRIDLTEEIKTVEEFIAEKPDEEGTESDPMLRRSVGKIENECTDGEIESMFSVLSVEDTTQGKERPAP